jgi:hypothetical protein
MMWPQSRRKRICRQKEKIRNNKKGFQVDQNCASPSCSDHLELYQEDECRMRRSSQDKSCQAPSFQEEHLTDKVAAIVDGFYHLNAHGRKNALMREIADISDIKVGQKRPSKGGG